MGSPVAQQVATVLKRHPADAAAEHPFSHVDLQVTWQVSHPCKHPLANPALKRLFARVSSFVTLQIFFLRERFWAEWAAEGLILCVSLLVMGGVTLVVRGVGAKAALVCVPARLHPWGREPVLAVFVANAAPSTIGCSRQSCQENM